MRKKPTLWPAKIFIEDWFFLERVSSSHAFDIFQLVEGCRDYLGRWLPWVDQTKDPSDTEVFIRGAEEGARKNAEVHYAISCNNEIVGLVGFPEIDVSQKKGVMGFWLSEKAQGFGLMTRACDALIREALLRQNLETIEIRCGRENLKSRAIPERLKFSVSREVRDAEIVQNVSIDHVVYSLSKIDLLRQ